MRKCNAPVPFENEDLDYTPRFHCGDEVMIKYNSRTPQWKFYSGFRGIVWWIDTWWPDEYSYRIVFGSEEDDSLPTETWIKESDLEFCPLYDFEEDFWCDDEEEEVEKPKRGRWRPRKHS